MRSYDVFFDSKCLFMSYVNEQSVKIGADQILKNLVWEDGTAIIPAGAYVRILLMLVARYY